MSNNFSNAAGDRLELATEASPEGEVQGAGTGAFGGWLLAIFETALLLLVFALYGSSPPPDVNEAHYLSKAKHFWDPTWCSRDLFLSSAEAHWLFYVTFGALTQWFSLEQTAWIGRFVVWLGLAAGWTYLARGISRYLGAAVLSGIAWLLLIHYAHLSGEWVIGGIEAKGPAFVLMLVGLGRMVRKDWMTCWWWWGGATAFHVLAGGWTIVAALVAWWFIGRREYHSIWIAGRTLALGLFPAAAIGLIGIVPALGLEAGLDPDIVSVARYTYVFGRLPHHLVFSNFDPVRLLSFLSLLFLWVMLLGTTRCDSRMASVQLVAFGSLLLCGVGILLDRGVAWGVSAERMAGWLRFYWFRAADVLVPLAAAMTMMKGLESLEQWPRVFRHSLIPALALGCIALVFTIDSQRGDGRPRADQQTLPADPQAASAEQILEDWRRVCAWFRDRTAADTLVLTLREQQTFKWYAERAEVVNWKDVPQDAGGLIEWMKRYGEIYQQAYDQNLAAGTRGGLMIYSDATLREFGREYGADYLVVPRYQVYLRAQSGFASELKIVYPHPTATGDFEPSYFVVLELNANKSTESGTAENDSASAALDD